MLNIRFRLSVNDGGGVPPDIYQMKVAGRRHSSKPSLFVIAEIHVYLLTSKRLVHRSYNRLQISKNSMTGEGLFNLVRSLSKQQKANFSRFVDARKGSKPIYYTLFERLVSKKKYDEAQIRGAIFRSPSKFYQNREILADKLIQSMVHFNGSRGSVKSYVLHAIELNAPELAKKRLVSSMEEAVEAEDWASLDFLHRLRGELVEAYRLSFPLPDSVPTVGEVATCLRSWDSLTDLQARLKHHLQNNFGDHLFHAGTFRKKLDEIPVVGSKGKFLSQKVRVSLELLMQDYHGAVRHQENVVETLKGAKIFLKNALLFKELSILIRLAIEVKQDQVALRSTFLLGAISAENSREAVLKVYYQTKALIFVASSQANLEMAEDGLGILLQNRNLFTEEEIPTYLFNCVTVFFLFEEYGKALETLAIIRSAKRSQWEELNWSVDLLRVLCNYELGNLEVVPHLQRTLQRTAQSQEKAFPKFATRTVAKMMGASCKSDSLQIWEGSSEALENYKNDPKESLATNVFDLSLWLESKAKGIPLLQVFHNHRQEVKDELKKVL